MFFNVYIWYILWFWKVDIISMLDIWDIWDHLPCWLFVICSYVGYFKYSLMFIIRGQLWFCIFKTISMLDVLDNLWFIILEIFSDVGYLWYPIMLVICDFFMMLAYLRHSRCLTFEMNSGVWFLRHTTILDISDILWHWIFGVLPNIAYLRYPLPLSFFWLSLFLDIWDIPWFCMFEINSDVGHLRYSLMLDTWDIPRC